ncbi:16S rRNA (guanine(966)-N(2))-methyltransferase RsmD [Edaphobacter bradus]|uniref:16S rRNA (guanine(966)-N(2))-methyltransferase RsmD n=1 Tax=Edaphobacter bradus TaxID=2259016 RepID=UPI0021E04438|nr:16S rRNA (guanine(966)-N(2))-methyltransferase RsmD [Edaphobacter bradus]
MRVIAGTYRSRPLAAPRGMDTRPTSDRLRETLFNILAPRIEGSRFLDLYAGTGAVGIEALSRGTAQVWFVEDAAPAVKVIRANLASLKIGGGYTLEVRSAAAALERMSKQGLVADIVFLDPPYEAEAEYARTLEFLGNARGRLLLAEGALVIAEHRSKTSLAEQYGALERTRVVKQGDAALSFFAIPLLSAEDEVKS